MPEVPNPVEAERQDLLQRYGIKPEVARAKLLTLGYEEGIWDQLLDYDKASHEVRALVVIARSDSPQLYEDAVAQIVVNEVSKLGEPISVSDVVANRDQEYIDDLRVQSEELNKWYARVVEN